MTDILLYLTIILWALFLYPYIVYPILLYVLPKHQSEKKSSRDKATVRGEDVEIKCSLLFCAYNEVQSLPKKIKNIRELKLKMPGLQVLAYSDCSDDGTNELLKEASDLLTPVFGTERLGKVLGMRKLVSMAESEVLIFTDANVTVEPDSLPRLIAYFDDPEVGAVAGTLLYDAENQERSLNDGSVVAQVGGVYWRLEEYIKRLESRSGSMMGTDGALFARRRDGYPDIPSDLVDDMCVSMEVIFKGLRCISAPDVYGYEESVQNSKEEFRRKRRIACGSYSTYRHMRGQLKNMSLLNKFKFVSHKLLRWWGAFFILAGGLSFLAFMVSIGLWKLGVSIVCIGCAVFYLGIRKEIGPIQTIYEILAAVTATGLGVLESMFGMTYSTWNPAQTRQ